MVWNSLQVDHQNHRSQHLYSAPPSPFTGGAPLGFLCVQTPEFCPCGCPGRPNRVSSVVSSSPPHPCSQDGHCSGGGDSRGPGLTTVRPAVGAEPSPALLVPSTQRRSRKTSKDTGDSKDGGAPGSEEPGTKARGRGRKPSTKAKGGRCPSSPPRVGVGVGLPTLTGAMLLFRQFDRLGNSPRGQAVRGQGATQSGRICSCIQRKSLSG